MGVEKIVYTHTKQSAADLVRSTAENMRVYLQIIVYQQFLVKTVEK